MIRLIGNELYKIFNKKSTYIFLIFMIAIVVITNIFNKNSEIYYSTDEERSYYAENCRKNLKYNPDDKQCKTMLDIDKEIVNYSLDSWQYHAITVVLPELISSYYDDSDKKEDLNKIFSKAKESLSTGDWKYIVNLEIDVLNKEIENTNASLNKEGLSESQNESIKIDLFVLNERLNMLKYRIDENVPYGSDYLNVAINHIIGYSYEMGKNQISNTKLDENLEYEIEEYNKYKYILENKHDIENIKTLRYSLIEFADNYSFIILLFIIMIAGSIISDEFNKGTIKSLLITPYKRSTIVMSKFLTVLLMLVFVSVFLFAAQFIVGTILFGFSDLNVPYVYYDFSVNAIKTVGIFKYSIMNFMGFMPEIILLITLAFFLSTIFKSSALSIILPVLGMAGSEVINVFAKTFKVTSLNYFVTTNWDFNNYMFGNTSPFGLTIEHSIIVCLVYFLIMLIAAIIIFKKTDIKNI